MRLPPGLFIFLLAACLSLQGLCQNSNYDPGQRYSVVELHTDFQFLKMKLEKIHPNLYLYTPKAEFDLFFDSLYKSIVHPLTETEFYNVIAPLNSKIKDGHTMLLPGTEATNYFNRSGKFLPFYIVIINSKLYVTMNCSNDASIKDGSEIVSINGTSEINILNQLLTEQVRDGNNQTYPIWILNSYFKEYFSFHSDIPPVF